MPNCNIIIQLHFKLFAKRQVIQNQKSLPNIVIYKRLMWILIIVCILHGGFALQVFLGEVLNLLLSQMLVALGTRKSMGMDITMDITANHLLALDQPCGSISTNTLIYSLIQNR